MATLIKDQWEAWEKKDQWEAWGRRTNGRPGKEGPMGGLGVNNQEEERREGFTMGKRMVVYRHLFTFSPANLKD